MADFLAFDPKHPHYQNYQKLKHGLGHVRNGIAVFVNTTTQQYHTVNIAAKECDENATFHTCSCIGDSGDVCEKGWSVIYEILFSQNRRKHRFKPFKPSYTISRQIKKQYWEIAHFYNHNCRMVKDASNPKGIDEMDLYGLLLNMIHAKHLGDKLSEDNDCFDCSKINGVRDIFTKVCLLINIQFQI